jgi:hypothetical protein
MGPEGRVAGKVYVFAAAGGRLRFEVVSPMETPVRTVAVDGTSGTFTMTDHEAQRCTEAAADPCLVREAIGVELAPAHVAATLVGAPPLLRHRDATSRWSRCGYYEIDLQGREDGWSESLRVTPASGEFVATKAVITGPQGVVLDIELRNHEPVQGLLLPRRLAIRAPVSRGDLRVEVRSVELDVDLPESAFRARCPEGFSVEPATCESASSPPVLEETSAPTPPLPEPEPRPDAGAPGGDLNEELGL